MACLVRASVNQFSDLGSRRGPQTTFLRLKMQLTELTCLHNGWYNAVKRVLNLHQGQNYETNPSIGWSRWRRRGFVPFAAMRWRKSKAKTKIAAVSGR